MSTLEEKYLILSTTSPTTVYPVENIGLREDIYTIEEIDALLTKFAKEMKALVDDVIIMSDNTAIPDPNRTSMWMEVVDKDIKGDFDDWYDHNNRV